MRSKLQAGGAPLTRCTCIIKKKCSEETQTLRASCSKAEPKIFTPPQTPFPAARDGQNLISCMITIYLHLRTQFGEDRCTHAISSYRSNRPTHPHTHKKHPQTGPITIYCAAASAQCNNASAGLHRRRQFKNILTQLCKIQMTQRSLQTGVGASQRHKRKSDQRDANTSRWL